MFSNKASSHSYKPISLTNSDDSSDSFGQDDFIQQQIKKQQRQLQDQDKGLEMLSQSASRLGTLSLGISEELGNQNK